MISLSDIARAVAGVSMTERQRKANNGKVGRIVFHGVRIAIEQPMGTMKNGHRLSAHYGYIEGTKGADGAAIDCFVGSNVHSTTVFAIDHHRSGQFDEHKIVFGCDHEGTASDIYRHTYGKPPAFIKRLTIEQFKAWIKDKTMSDKPTAVYWKGETPENSTFDSVLYMLRRLDPWNELQEPMLLDDIYTDDIESRLELDALVLPVNRLDRAMRTLMLQLQRVSGEVTPLDYQVSDPVSKKGAAHVAVIFELSDGQTVTIWFHNPDVTPRKLQPTDDLVSWKWVLNKKDITIVVAPEKGRDLVIRDVARRVIRLAEKNSAAFARANAKRAEKMQAIETLKTEVEQLQATVDESIKSHTERADFEAQLVDYPAYQWDGPLDPIYKPAAAEAPAETVNPSAAEYAPEAPETSDPNAAENVPPAPEPTPEPTSEPESELVADPVEQPAEPAPEPIDEVAEVAEAPSVENLEVPGEAPIANMPFSEGKTEEPESVEEPAAPAPVDLSAELKKVVRYAKNYKSVESGKVMQTLTDIKARAEAAGQSLSDAPEFEKIVSALRDLGEIAHATLVAVGVESEAQVTVEEPEMSPELAEVKEFLQTVIANGLEISDEAGMDRLIEIAEKYDGDPIMQPLIDQAADVVEKQSVEAARAALKELGE